MTEEPLAKKARLGRAYYKQINGVKYDRELLEMAEEFAENGQVSYPEARALWEAAHDGLGVTEIEKKTLQYSLDTITYTEKAANYMKDCLKSDSPTSYYKQIDGVKYDRALLETAEVLAKNGQVSYPEAIRLWEDAQDGKGITECERKTLEYTLSNLKYTDKAKRFMNARLNGLEISHYKQINGVRYDHMLLKKAQALCEDGAIGKSEAETLWQEAQDGKEISDTANKTLEYTLVNLKYEPEAQTFMKGKLGLSSRTLWLKKTFRWRRALLSEKVCRWCKRKANVYRPTAPRRP